MHTRMMSLVAAAALGACAPVPKELTEITVAEVEISDPRLHFGGGVGFGVTIGDAIMHVIDLDGEQHGYKIVFSGPSLMRAGFSTSEVSTFSPVGMGMDISEASPPPEELDGGVVLDASVRPLSVADLLGEYTGLFGSMHALYGGEFHWLTNEANVSLWLAAGGVGAEVGVMFERLQLGVEE